MSCNGPQKLYLGVLPKGEKVNLKLKNEWILMATMVEEKELHLNFTEGNCRGPFFLGPPRIKSNTSVVHQGPKAQQHQWSTVDST
jgi:hypothetical protein